MYENGCFEPGIHILVYWIYKYWIRGEGKIKYKLKVIILKRIGFGCVY